MKTHIGIVSGEILELLDEKQEPMSVAEIRDTLEESLELVHMAIGWLIRDDYVVLVRTHPNASCEDSWCPDSWSLLCKEGASSVGKMELPIIKQRAVHSS